MFRVRSTAIHVFTGLALAAFSARAGMKATAEESAAFPPAYDIQMSDVTAKVGEPAVLRATLKARDGYRTLKHYNNRVIQLSSLDDGVAFESKMVEPTAVDDGSFVFEVPLHATKAGKHPINGVFRVGYIHGTDDISMVNMRLIANVTGTE
jgi:hypothetical protein